MRRSINLNDEASVEGCEVNDESAKNNLTSKAEAANLPASETFPETSFGIRCIASE
jgi:hypothetical protein